MTPIGYLLAGTGAVLQIMLTGRCITTGAWSRYPLFLLFVASNVARILLLTYLVSAGAPWYPKAYWYSEVLSYVLMFGVAFEALRVAFPRDSIASRVAGAAVLFLLLVLAAVFFTSQRPGELVIPDILRKSGIALAAWLAMIVIVARYFGVSLNRNLIGIVAGVGMLVSISVVNLSAFGIQSSLFSIIRYVGPVWALIVYCLWIYTLWYYRPAPLPSPRDESSLARVQGRWMQEWRRLGLTLRRMMKP